MEAMLLTPVSDEELMLALSAVVTQEGRVSGLSVLSNDATGSEIEMILEGISQARLEPARVGSDPDRRQPRVAADAHHGQGQGSAKRQLRTLNYELYWTLRLGVSV